MRVHRVDPVVGAALHGAGAQLARFQPLLKAAGEVFAGVLHLAPGGHLGPHETPLPRVVLIVRGDGKVRLAGGNDVPVHPGDAVYWDARESVHLESAGGLMGLVFEGADVQTLAPEAVVHNS